MGLNRWLFPLVSFALLLLSALACSKASPAEIRHFTLTPTSSPIPSETLQPITPSPAPILAADTLAPASPEPSATPWLGSISALQAVNIREEPGEGSASLGVLYSGSQVILSGSCSGSWAEIQFGAGRAWIRSRYLSPDPCL